MSKTRTVIPPDISARVLFQHDRTCCVCRQRGKPVQIHHLDEDPANHRPENLAVLCFDCHRDTQIRGGFDRKLDRDQIVLYREDWHLAVRRQRAVTEANRESSSQDNSIDVALATSIAEIYREKGDYELLAVHYDALGNVELRDKYIALALEKDGTDHTLAYLRGLQGKPELIPPAVIDRELARYDEDKNWLQKARFLTELGRHREAIQNYLRGIAETLEEGNLFSAAFYLKELQESELTKELFILALAAARTEPDLWWQVRALQELAWNTELKDLLLSHAAEIESSGNPMLQMVLADVKGDTSRSVELRKAIAKADIRRVGATRESEKSLDEMPDQSSTGKGGDVV